MTCRQLLALSVRLSPLRWGSSMLETVAEGAPCAGANLSQWRASPLATRDRRSRARLAPGVRVTHLGGRHLAEGLASEARGTGLEGLGPGDLPVLRCPHEGVVVPDPGGWDRTVSTTEGSSGTHGVGRVMVTQVGR